MHGRPPVVALISIPMECIYLHQHMSKDQQIEKSISYPVVACGIKQKAMSHYSFLAHTTEVFSFQIVTIKNQVDNVKCILNCFKVKPNGLVFGIILTFSVTKWYHELKTCRFKSSFLGYHIVAMITHRLLTPMTTFHKGKNYSKPMDFPSLQLFQYTQS